MTGNYFFFKLQVKRADIIIYIYKNNRKKEYRRKANILLYMCDDSVWQILTKISYQTAPVWAKINTFLTSISSTNLPDQFLF